MKGVVNELGSKLQCDNQSANDYGVKTYRCSISQGSRAYYFLKKFICSQKAYCDSYEKQRWLPWERVKFGVETPPREKG